MHCADRIVATASSNGFVKSNSQCASGYPSASARVILRTRLVSPRSRPVSSAAGWGGRRVVGGTSLAYGPSDNPKCAPDVNQGDTGTGTGGGTPGSARR
ncbi:hypothetical protein GCM10010483_35910 [Actinokineospora diospyrosa]